MNHLRQVGILLLAIGATACSTSIYRIDDIPQPESIEPDPECGITKGCFHNCNNTGLCGFQVTWQDAGEFTSFTMSQNISDSGNVWIALGISDNTFMRNTSVNMCKHMNDTVTLELGYNKYYPQQYEYTTLAANTSDLILTNGSLVDGIFTCSFHRRKTITEFNYTFPLTEKRYLIVANGPVKSGVPVKHTTKPTVSEDKLDFIHYVQDTTTVNPGEITTQSGSITPDPECGITKGCFHNCSDTGLCAFQVTWQDAGEFTSFTMSQNISDSGNVWIALGISDNTFMRNTSVNMCKHMNDTVTLELGYNIYFPKKHEYTTLASNTSDLVLTDGSLVDGIFTCSFHRRKTITEFNYTFPLTEKRYLIVAHGVVVSGVPKKHTTKPTVSGEKVDFIHYVHETTTVNPGEITTQPGSLVPDPDCGITKGCYHNCDNSGLCRFQVTWQDAGEFTSFTMSQNLSASGMVWIALGISPDMVMKNTSVNMCKHNNDTIGLELGYNPKHAYNYLTSNTTDLVLTGGSLIDGIFTCSFRRRKIITEFNDTFPLTSKRYLIVAHGTLLPSHFLPNGLPMKHRTDPIVSPDKQDFIHYIIGNDTTTHNPGEITTPSGSTIVKDPACGKSKGCLSNCNAQGRSCTFLVTWRNLPDTIQFEIKCTMTPGQDSWMAIGLAAEQKMPGASVMMCIMQNHEVTTELGYNTNDPSFAPMPNKTAYLYNAVGSIDGDVMTCTYERAKNVSGSNTPGSSKIFDLEKEWYLLFAHGLAPSGIPQKHTTHPVISAGKVNFLKTGDVGAGTEKSLLVQLHGSLMMVAWIVLSTSGMLTARYFKDIFHSKLGGKHLWFQLHRTCMSTVVLITLAALALIFVEVGGFSKISVPDNISYVQYHPIIGLTAVGLMLLNPFMAFFRCDHGAKYRPVFDWLHWGVATLAQLSAGFNIAFGIHLEKVNMPIKKSLTIIYSFAGTLVGMFIVFEILKRITKWQSGQYADDDIRTDIGLIQKERKSNYNWQKIFFGFHIIAMISYAATLIVYLLNG